MRQRMTVGLTWWLTLVLFYWLLVGKPTLPEMITGSLAAAVATVAVMAVRAQSKQRFQAELEWVGLARRLPGRVLADCAVVAAALWRRLVRRERRGGILREILFDVGGDDDARALARRALVITNLSLAPNTYVVALDKEKGMLLVHQLVPSREPPGRSDREWPL